MPGPHSKKQVLIAGGGVAAVEIAMGLSALAPRLADVELISPDPEFTYRPLAVAEPFGVGEMTRFDLRSIAADHNANYRYGALSAVDPDERVVVLADGRRLEYDLLAVAIGARPADPFPGGLAFGSADARREFRQLLDQLGDEGTRRIVFAVPPGVVWALPLYELAMMTAAFAAGRELGVAITLVTPEEAPLGVFGARASDAVRELLAERGIQLLTGHYPVEARPGELRVSPGDPVRADHVVTLPRLCGAGIEGLPADGAGFLPVDLRCRVEGVDFVWAAGDGTNVPVKQGGLAAQQADVVAEGIAQALGADVEPREFRPVLRGLLLTGGIPSYLRAEITGGRGDASEADVEPLWWPPGKIAGRWLSSYFATLQASEPPAHGIRIEVDDLTELIR